MDVILGLKKKQHPGQVSVFHEPFFCRAHHHLDGIPKTGVPKMDDEICPVRSIKSSQPRLLFNIQLWESKPDHLDPIEYTLPETHIAPEI